MMMPDLKACKETNSTNNYPNIKLPDIEKFTTKLTNIDSPLNTSSDARRRPRRRSPTPPSNLSYKPASDMAQKIKKSSLLQRSRYRPSSPSTAKDSTFAQSPIAAGETKVLQWRFVRIFTNPRHGCIIFGNEDVGAVSGGVDCFFHLT